MALINTLLLKGATGFMTAILGCTGFYFSNSYLNNRLTRYDIGLMDFLNLGGKIKFKVEKDNQDLSSFPSFDNTDPIIIRASISTDGSSTGQLVDSSSNPKGQKSELKNLNGKNDWTWICEINIKKIGEGIENIKNLNSREKNILKRDTSIKPNTPNGFFDKLSDLEKHKELKIRFIKKCGLKRGYLTNRAINSLSQLKNNEKIMEENKIKSSKEFNLVKQQKNNYSEEEKLRFESWREFEDWFE